MGASLQIRREIGFQLAIIGPGRVRDAVLDEKVERVDRGHVSHKVHNDFEMIGLLGEDQPRHVIAERVLLPVQEMRLGRDHLRVAEDLGARMRRGAQPDDLRTHFDRTVISIGRAMRQRGVDAHPVFPMILTVPGSKAYMLRCKGASVSIYARQAGDARRGRNGENNLWRADGGRPCGPGHRGAARARAWRMGSSRPPQ